MNDIEMTDMGPFMRRHDLKTRRIFIALLATILLVAVADFIYGIREFGSAGAFPGRLWFGMLFPLVPVTVIWLGAMVVQRKRRMQPDGSLPMNPDDARNAERVANVGAVYFAGIGLVSIAGQVFAELQMFHLLPALDGGGVGPFARLSVVATGVLVAYFGNAWPRMPTPRGQTYKAATHRRFNRVLGWILVIHGLLFGLVGLFMQTVVAFSVGTGIVGASMVLCALGRFLMLHFAMRSASAA